MADVTPADSIFLDIGAEMFGHVDHGGRRPGVAARTVVASLSLTHAGINVPQAVEDSHRFG